MTIKRNGGIWFWRLGRIGGSFYVAKRKQPRSEWTRAAIESRYEIAATLVTVAAIIGWGV